MRKLPATAHAKLAAAFASGKIPDGGDPGYNDFWDIYSDLEPALDDDWANPAASTARRHVSALVSLGNAIPADGLTVGVACNQPGIVAVAIEAADAMNLASIRPTLAKIQACIPPNILALDDAGDRQEWYGSPVGEPLAEKLEAIEQEDEEGELGTVLLEAAVRRVLAQPRESFEG